jgi:hypothetical protein
VGADVTARNDQGPILWNADIVALADHIERRNLQPFDQMPGIARIQYDGVDHPRNFPAGHGAETIRPLNSRAYVEFALGNPKLFRLMFGERGHCCLAVQTDGQPPPATPTPYEILGRALDGLVADKVLDPKKRGGAELKAWSVVHGFALLALDRQAAFSSRQRHSLALESMLDFAVAGICGGMEKAKPKVF